MDKEKLKTPQAVTKLAKQWMNFTEKDKMVWDKKTQPDKKRHQKQMSDLMKNGYFMMADGQKSSDYKVETPRRTTRATQPKQDPPAQKKTKKWALVIKFLTFNKMKFNQKNLFFFSKYYFEIFQIFTNNLKER